MLDKLIIKGMEYLDQYIKNLHKVGIAMMNDYDEANAFDISGNKVIIFDREMMNVNTWIYNYEDIDETASMYIYPHNGKFKCFLTSTNIRGLDNMHKVFVPSSLSDFKQINLRDIINITRVRKIGDYEVFRDLDRYSFKGDISIATQE